MRSDDDGFASRQVSASTLLYSGQLNYPIPYMTPTFDVSKFASCQFQFVPSAASGYPVYITVYWWSDRDQTILVTSDIVSWYTLPTDGSTRRWQGAIPCRADFMSVSYDAVIGGDMSAVIIGSSRQITGIVQQVGSRSLAGGPPFALQYNNQVLPVGPSNGTSIHVPPWFGEVEIGVYTNCPDGFSTYLLVYNTGASNTGAGVDTSIISLQNGVGGCYTSQLANTRWNKARFALNGQQLRLLGGNTGPAAGTMITYVMPITGHLG